MYWLYRARTPNAASRQVVAITSGTIAAMTAPNAISRIRNVSGQRQPERRVQPAVDQLLDLVVGEVVVERVDGERRDGPSRISSTKAGTGSSRAPRASPSPTTRDGIRTVVRSGGHELGRGRRGQRVDQLVDGRDGRAVDRGLQRAEAGHDVGDGRRGRRIVDGAVLRADDEEQLLAGRLDRPGPGAEHVVGPGRLEPRRLVVRDRGGGVRAAGRDARGEDPERERRTTGRRPASDGGRSSRRRGRSRAGGRRPGRERGAAWCLTRRVAYRGRTFPVVIPSFTPGCRSGRAAAGR